MTTYEVIHPSSNEVIATGFSAGNQVICQMVPSNTGREYDIRASRDGHGFEVWTRDQVMNEEWGRTILFSINDGLTTYTTEIDVSVIAAWWFDNPIVLTDAQYAEMQAADKLKCGASILY